MSCNSSDPPAFCSDASPELKLYQAFIFSVPVFFTFILLLLFYLFYLRRRRASWESLRMRVSNQVGGDMARYSESGIKKEVRELLPIVVFKESFLIRETQCSVCLADYKSDDRLKRIPPCGHTFHVECIDHWLTTNITCPLCRASLIPTPKPAADTVNLEVRPNDLEGPINRQIVVVEAEIHEREVVNTVVLHENGVEQIERPHNSNDETVCCGRDEECRSVVEATALAGDVTGNMV